MVSSFTTGSLRCSMFLVGPGAHDDGKFGKGEFWSWEETLKAKWVIMLVEHSVLMDEAVLGCLGRFRFW